MYRTTFFFAVLGLSLLSCSTPPKAVSGSKLQSTEGTFLGIEQGDYAHWKMRTKSGEMSYFILRPDASVAKILDRPESRIGEPCRVQWKTTIENIPEAGGKVAVEQVVSIEWTGSASIAPEAPSKVN